MNITISCSCGRKIVAPPKFAGKKVRCPACRAVVQIPDSDIPEVDIEVLEADDSSPPAVPSEDIGEYGVSDSDSMSPALGPAVRDLAGAVGALKLQAVPRCLAYSPSFAWAACDREEGIQILDMRGNKKAFVFEEHEEQVTALTFSPDSTTVLSGDEAGNVLWWDLERRRPIRWLKGHHAAVTSAAIAPNGLFAVTGSKDGEVRLWELDKGGEFDLDAGDTGVCIHHLAFSFDGTLLAAAGDSGFVGMWVVRTGRFHEMPGASKSMVAVAFSPDASLLTACRAPGMIRAHGVYRWKVATRKTVACFEKPSESNCVIERCALVPGGEHLVTVGYVPPKPDAGDRLSSGLSATGIGGLIPAAVHLYSATRGIHKDITNRDYRFQVWRVKTGSRTQDIAYSGAKSRCLAVAPKGGRALVGTKEPRIHVLGLGIPALD